MASLKTTHEALFVGHASGFITDAEFLLLHQENSSDNLYFPYDNYPRFSLQDQSQADCIANFRLEKHHVGRLCISQIEASTSPQAFDFFENYCSNSPLPGPKRRSNAPH